MTDRELVRFLRWALPRLRMRWEGFRKVRRQVGRRLRRRMAELRLERLEEYSARLDEDPHEWERLDALCRITISRFFRDREAFLALGEWLGAARASTSRELSCWSAGCASGEEPYSLTILWRLGVRGPGERAPLEVWATDADPRLIERARLAHYPPSSLRDVPEAWREQAFRPEGEGWTLRAPYRLGVRLRVEDLRRQLPDRSFDLILCRNLVFTYYEEPLQRELLAAFLDRLTHGGALVIGSHETLPRCAAPLRPWGGPRGLFRRGDLP